MDNDNGNKTSGYRVVEENSNNYNQRPKKPRNWFLILIIIILSFLLIRTKLSQRNTAVVPLAEPQVTQAIEVSEETIVEENVTVVDVFVEDSDDSIGQELGMAYTGEDALTKEYKNVKFLEINVPAAEVVIKKESGNTEKIIAKIESDHHLDKYEFYLNRDSLNINFAENNFITADDKLTITVVSRNDFNLDGASISTVDKDIKIEEVDFSYLEINTKDGDFQLRSSSVSDNIIINNVSGEVDIKDIKTETININNVSGRISVKDSISNQSLEINNVSSDSDIDNVRTKHFNGNSTSGDFDLVIDSETVNISKATGDTLVKILNNKAQLNFETVSGNVECRLKPDSNVYLESPDGNKKISSNLNLVDSNEDYQVIFSTLSGNLELNAY